MSIPNQPDTLVGTRILLINLHSSRNAGDAALTLMAMQQLTEHFPDCVLTLAMNDPDSHHQYGQERVVGSFARWVQMLPVGGKGRWNWRALVWMPLTSMMTMLIYRATGHAMFFGVSAEQRALLQVYLEADVVVSAPGNFLYSSGVLGLPFLIAIYAMVYAIVLGKPLYTMPQSIGPLKRWWEYRLVHWVCTHTRVLMLRELESLKVIEQAGVVHPKCLLIPDLAFAFTGVPHAKAQQWLLDCGIDVDNTAQPLLGVTAINWGAQQRTFTRQAHYEQAMAEAIRFFIEHFDGKVIFYPQVCGPALQGDDRVVARRIASQLQDKHEHIVVIEEPVAPDMLQAAYACMDLFIGTRMHSNIFALVGSVPVLAISYRSKTRGIMQMVGLIPYMVDIQTVDGQTLIAMLRMLWEESMQLQERITERVALLNKQARQAGFIIAADFRALQGER